MKHQLAVAANPAETSGMPVQADPKNLSGFALMWHYRSTSISAVGWFALIRQYLTPCRVRSHAIFHASEAFGLVLACVSTETLVFDESASKQPVRRP